MHYQILIGNSLMSTPNDKAENGKLAWPGLEPTLFKSEQPKFESGVLNHTQHETLSQLVSDQNNLEIIAINQTYNLFSINATFSHVFDQQRCNQQPTALCVL